MGKQFAGLFSDIFKNLETADFNQINAFLGSNYSIEDYDANPKKSLKSAYNKSYDTYRDTSIMKKAPSSIINRYSLLTYMGLHGTPGRDLSGFYKSLKSNELHGGFTTRNPTTTNIVNYFRQWKGGIEYDYSDFLFCNYNRKIPNNYLITVRRFAQPVEDNIYNALKKTFDLDSDGNAGALKSVDLTSPDMARAVTWMSEVTGNSMQDILSFTYGYNWNEQSNDENTRQDNESGYTNQPFYQKSGLIGRAFFDTVKGENVQSKRMKERRSGHDPLSETYENFVIGPVNVINKMMTRGRGLNFDQDLTLNFEYKLKSYEGINPKVAMLDIFANLMVLTYSNANFWGGANRFFSNDGYVASRFGDLDKLKSGDLSGYMGTVVDEVSDGFSNVFGTPDQGYTKESVLSGLKKVGGNILGNMLGGFVDSMFGAPPAYVAAKGMLTGEATGNWHITVGNPINPIAMMGNMILTDSKISFDGGLGYDDFPEKLKCSMTFKHARPRDKTDIESMFNAGKGRLYGSPEGFRDVLNLAGMDEPVYGAFQFDKNGKIKENRSQVNIRDADRISDNDYGRKAERFQKWGQSKSHEYLDMVDRFIHT
jgi:hypothetical protein